MEFSSYRTAFEHYLFYRPDGQKWDKTPKQYYDYDRVVGPFVLQDGEIIGDEVRTMTYLAVRDMEEAWFASARPVYKVWPAMLEALAHTSIDMSGNRLRFPFPAFKIDLPADNTFGESYGLPHVSGFMVGHLGGEGGILARDYWDESICVGFTPRIPRNAEFREACRKRIEKSEGVAHGTFPKFIKISLKDDETLKSIIEHPENAVYRCDKDMTSPEFQRAAIALATAIALIAIGGDNKLLKPVERAPAGKKRRKSAPYSSTQGWHVGADISLPREFSEATSKKESVSEGHELTFGHIRSGHLRYQPFGSKEDPKVKLIFIAPTVVRPDLPLQVAQRTYSVVEKNNKDE